MATTVPVSGTIADNRPARRKPPTLRRRTPTRDRPRRSPLLTLLTAIVLVYSLVPLVWLLVNSTKTQANLFSSFGLWFSGDFALFSNIRETLTYGDGEFVRWFANTVLYVVVGAGGATLLATLGGYGLAKFDFPGSRPFSRW